MRSALAGRGWSPMLNATYCCETCQYLDQLERELGLDPDRPAPATHILPCSCNAPLIPVGDGLTVEAGGYHTTQHWQVSICSDCGEVW